MKVQLVRADGGAQLELVGECADDFATLRAFAEATSHGGLLRLAVGRDGDETVDSLTLEAPAAANGRAGPSNL
jgi:hypothetical protein